MIFIGSYPFSWFTLNALLKNNFIPEVLITIKGDKKSDYLFYKNCLKSSFLSNTKIILINKKQDLLQVKVEQSNYLITSAFPFLVPNNILSKARKLALNVHPSLLPRWRGPDPIRNAIVAEDKYIGVSIHKMTGIFDKGEIIAQCKYINDGEATLSDYIKLLAESGANLIMENIRNPKIEFKNKKNTFESIYKNEPYAHNISSKLASIKDTMPREYQRLIK